MKPRIVQSWVGRGVWLCRYPGTKSGLGFSPKAAYDDWLARTSEAAGLEAK